MRRTFTLTSVHLFYRERKYFLSRAQTFVVVIKNIINHTSSPNCGCKETAKYTLKNKK